MKEEQGREGNEMECGVEREKIRIRGEGRAKRDKGRSEKKEKDRKKKEEKSRHNTSVALFPQQSKAEISNTLMSRVCTGYVYVIGT